MSDRNEAAQVTEEYRSRVKTEFLQEGGRRTPFERTFDRAIR